MHHLFSFLWENASCLLMQYHRLEVPVVSSLPEEEGRYSNYQSTHDNLVDASTLFHNHIIAKPFSWCCSSGFSKLHIEIISVTCIWISQDPQFQTPFCGLVFIVLSHTRSVLRSHHSLIHCNFLAALEKFLTGLLDIVNQVSYMSEFFIVIYSCMIITSEKCHDCPKPVPEGNHTTNPVAIVQWCNDAEDQ